MRRILRIEGDNVFAFGQFLLSTYPLGGDVYHAVGDIDPLLKRQIRARDINLWFFLSMHQWCFIEQKEWGVVKFGILGT